MTFKALSFKAPKHALLVVSMGYWINRLSLPAGKRCVTPNNPDNGKLSCSGIGDFMYCSVICNTGKQLFKYSIGSSCNPSSLVWTPAEIPDCVGLYPNLLSRVVTNLDFISVIIALKFLFRSEEFKIKYIGRELEN